MKRYLHQMGSSILILLLLCQVLIFQPLYAMPSSWADAEIKLASDAKLIVPSVGSNYQQNINRINFSRLVVNLIELATGKTIEVSIQNPFSDTQDMAVLKAFQLGIVSGKSATQFKPFAPVLRQEIAYMLMKSVRIINQLNQIDFIAPNIDDIHFSDDHLIAEYALVSVKECVALGILNGLGDNRINPRGTTSLEQSLLMILRVYILFDPKVKLSYDALVAKRKADAEEEQRKLAEEKKKNEIESAFNSNQILLKAKFGDNTAADGVWWKQNPHQAYDYISVGKARVYRPVTVGEIKNNYGCFLYDAHTNLSDDDDLNFQKNEWVMYDLVQGSLYVSGKGNNYSTAYDYVKSRGKSLPSTEQLMAIYSSYSMGKLEREAKWPIGLYWSSEESQTPGKHVAVDMSNGTIVSIDKTTPAFVAAATKRSDEITESVTFMLSSTYYKPLQVNQIAHIGSDGQKDIQEIQTDIPWALYDTNPPAIDGITAETVVYDLNYRLPSSQELLQLYKAFPGGLLRSELGWPLGPYWAVADDGTVGLFNMEKGTFHNTDKFMMKSKNLVLPIEDPVASNASETDITYSNNGRHTIYKPETVDQLKAGTDYFDTFNWMGYSYPIFSQLAHASSFNQYIAQKKSHGLRLPTQDEIEYLLSNNPGLQLASNLGWPAGKNGLAPIGYYAEISPGKYGLFSTVTGELHTKDIELEGITIKTSGLMFFIKTIKK